MGGGIGAEDQYMASGSKETGAEWMSRPVTDTAADSLSQVSDQNTRTFDPRSESEEAVQRAVHFEDGRVVLVGIPAYNAENSVGTIVEKARNFADLVVVVDDGSKDETSTRAEEAGAIVVRHKRNRGYGGALQTIFKEADQRDVDHLITLDADEQHDPNTIPALVTAQIEHNADIVIGSRYVPGSNTELPFVRSLGLGLVNLLTNWTIGRFSPRNWIRDTQSGFRAYNRDAIESLAAADEVGNGMWASTDILYHASREQFSFFEVGTNVRYDVEHGSTEGALSHGISLVSNIFRFAQRTHPLLLLGFPGTLFFIFGIALSVLTIELILLPQYILLSSVILAIVSGMFVVVGMSLLILSWILHAFNIHPHFQK